MNVGEMIKQLRNQKLWTQEDLAEKSNISERTLRRLETTKSLKSRSNTLSSVLSALEINYNEFLKMLDEDEKKNEINDSKFLFRIYEGKEIINLIRKTHELGYNYNDCITTEQIEAAQNFLSITADIMDILDEVSINQRFVFENDLSENIKHLNNLGLWVFGLRIIESNNDEWITTIIEIYSKDNPQINKVDLI